jgi:hypothetical protein
MSENVTGSIAAGKGIHLFKSCNSPIFITNSHISHSLLQKNTQGIITDNPPSAHRIQPRILAKRVLRTRSPLLQHSHPTMRTRLRAKHQNEDLCAQLTFLLRIRPAISVHPPIAECLRGGTFVTRGREL